MRILQVIPFFTPQMGGSAEVAYQISKHLGERGHEVTVVTSNYAIGQSQFDTGKFQVVYFPNVLARWGFYVSPGLIPWARKYINNFDIIHLHNVRSFQNAVIRYFAVKHKVPYVLSAHGSLPIIVERRFPKRVYDILIGRKLLRDGRYMIAVSPVEADQYRAAGVSENQIRLINNGFNLEEFINIPSKGEFRDKLGIAIDTKIILYLGRLHKRKGINYLIKAYDYIVDHIQNCVLIIAGPDDGELHSLLTMVKKLNLQKHVLFSGSFYGRDKLAAYVDADVVVLPGIFEIFGLVSFEALLCNTPVVVSDGCGSSQLIAEANAGYLVTYGDVFALANVLVQALVYREEAKNKVKAGQKFIREHLDWEVIISEFEQLFQKVANDSGRSFW